MKVELNDGPTTTRGYGSPIWLYGLTAFVSLFGLADAIYRAIEHIIGQSFRCTIIAGCSEVLRSPYAVDAGVPLAMIGAAAYFSVFSLATLAVFGYRIAGPLLAILVGAMLMVSLWLIYLQAFVIHAFCQFCLISAAITFILAVCVGIATLRSRHLPTSVQ